MTKKSAPAPYVFTPAPIPVLPIKGSAQLFPVRRVYCVGRNYAAHAVEMGHDPDKEPPFFFQKNPDNLTLSGRFAYPSLSRDVHYEIEMVVALGEGGENISLAAAPRCVFGYGVGLDMTRRDLQAAAKDKGRPWESGKAFENSAPCSPLVPVSATGPLSRGAIRLDVNGKCRQVGDLDQMIWKVPEIISSLSSLFTLAPGDIIFTGTPSGVGAVTRGDRLSGHLDNVGDIEVVVV